jgi:AraC family transcriptional regulator
MQVNFPPPLEIRSPHGLVSFSYTARYWSGVDVYCVTQYTGPGRCWQNLAADRATVSVVLEQQDGICEPRKRLNTPTARHRYDAGHTMYIPPDVDIWGYGDSTTLVRDVRMRFDLKKIESFFGEEWRNGLSHEPVLLLYDDRLRKIAQLIWDECKSDSCPALYGESLTTALLAGLFMRAPALSKHPASGLGQIQAKRVLEYVDANILTDLRLDELADVTGLSASQFGRAFKASMGMSPHRWVVERRVQLAQRFMRDQGKPISIAANLAGFANQGHFTKAFRTVIGTTPGSWLRDQVATDKRKRLDEERAADLDKLGRFWSTQDHSNPL